METNPEQMAAVRHIVAGTSRPAPYLIYGPPGTGKTFTMVEAIKQVGVCVLRQAKIISQRSLLACLFKLPETESTNL